MIQLFFKLSKFIPGDCYKTIFLIDYNKLYEEGKRLILMDIDNTMVPHNESLADDELLTLYKKIVEIGFEVILISNNHQDRVSKFSKYFGAKFIFSAYKPFRKGYKKALKLAKRVYNNEEIVAVGDQLLTDVLGANRFGIDMILVNTLKMENEKWYTRINRLNEEKIMKRLRKKYPDAYKKIKEIKE